MAPFFPHEAAKKGVSETVTGLVFSAYALMGFLMGPTFGKLIPAFGPKFTLLAGTFLTGVSCVIFGTLGMIENTMVFVALCFVMRIMEGVGYAAYNTAVFSITAHMFPNNVGVAMGLLELFVGIGLTVGPALGAFLYEVGGYGLPFYALGGFMIMTIPINSMILRSDEEFLKDQLPESRAIGPLLCHGPSVLICGIITVIAMNITSLSPTLQPHVAEIGLKVSTAGLLFVLNLGCYTLMSPIAGWISDRFPFRRRTLIAFGIMMSGISFCFLGPVAFLPFLENSLLTNVIGLLINGFGNSLSLVPTFQAIHDAALNVGYAEGIGTLSVVSGMWSGMASLGEVLGPAASSSLYAHYGMPVVGLAFFGLCMVASTLLATVDCVSNWRRQQPQITPKDDEMLNLNVDPIPNQPSNESNDHGC
ncbi:unnamed protein product [Cyprideis torosa]|uniref:Uncharacterized protein n=1 Tax=Cyprideis torosa TaxID=163714 RepID=A0A7R8ZGT7_9CRUS|nr:unnamed protein product [Cyprideis torosa]CAG0880998.1 unnamed protein product [Cyprideis torosa]